jgi:inactivated superfamily I helicase
LKIFTNKQARNLNKLAKQIDKTFSKIDLSVLDEIEIEKIIKFNKTLENLEIIYQNYIKPLEKVKKD